MNTVSFIKRHKLKRNIPLHIMLLPGVLLVLIFNYGPMFGIIMSFQDFNPGKGFLGSEFIGLDNFRYLLAMPNFSQVMFNTLFIAIMKMVAGLAVSIIFALLINEVQRNFIKRSIQTAIYLPHFLSWVILGGILMDILSPSEGIINIMIKGLGFEPVFFLGNADIFPYVIVVTDIWKGFGFGTIVYLAAIASIDPSLYESAVIDGANRWKQTIHITLPGMSAIIILLATLSLGGVLNAGFDQIFVLYSPLTYRTGDILDTFVYRLGLVELQFAVSAAVGFFKSAVSFVLIVFSYRLAYKYANYRIF